MKVEWGATRTVILVGRYAVKLPGRWVRSPTRWWQCFLQGLLANAQEREWWRDSPHREHLCPVVWSVPGGWCVIMRRATPLTDAQWTAIRDGHPESTLMEWDKPHIEYQIRTRDGDVLPGETKPSSFGILDGRTVVCDYGN